MKQLFIITGAAGHLGSTIIRLLQLKYRYQGCEIRGLVLPSEKDSVSDSPSGSAVSVKYYVGDVTDADTLEPLFAGLQANRTVLIHTAGLISIEDKVSPRLYKVNVEGTKNILEKCRLHGVDRLVHVGSVHAIPVHPEEGPAVEPDQFLADKVKGGYAKTKAEALAAVQESAEKGLDAVMVLPSGIIGPYDKGRNHLVQLLAMYLDGRLPACVDGGYDFTDVRDVARGCLLAVEKGKKGESYILSGEYCPLKEMLQIAKETAGGKRFVTLPLWSAAMAQPLLALWAKLRGQRPLYTRYSLYTISSGERFSHEKADRELGYQTRSIRSTVEDTVRYLQRVSRSRSRCLRRRRRLRAAASQGLS